MLGVVVANDLGVEVRNDHMCSTSLSQGLVSTITADSIVTVDNSLAIFIKPSNKVEGIVREESSSVESLGNKVSDGVSGGCSFDLVIINLELCFQDLPQITITLVSSQKSAYMPDVARMVLSVRGTSLLSLRVIKL